MKMTGAQILIKCLKAQGVDTVFGYPGSSVLEIYDELYRERQNIRHILTSHEQGAAHAADGYARTTKKVGVCIATSGPGATNLVTGIATAYMDSVPLVAITCNVEQERLGKDSFQEVDITGITMPVTKHGMIVKDIEALAPSVRKAFRIASEKRPGPVIIDITKDVLTAVTDYVTENGFDCGNTEEKESVTLNSADLIHVVRFLKQSKKPLILAGGGAKSSGAGAAIVQLAELLNAPVAVSLMGKGVVDETAENFLGMVGMHGTIAANWAVNECDLLIALGIRFSDRMTQNVKQFAPNARILQIDIDPAEINKNVLVELPLIGDVKTILEQICGKLKPSVHKQWLAELIKEKENEEQISSEGCNGAKVIQKLCRLTKGKAIITTEVGQHQMMAARHYKVQEGGEFLTSGGLGTMGYGLSAAIGSKLGNPGKTVINLAGDGCFRMNMNELLTASRHKIPIIQLVFDNQVLGLVYQWQRTQYNSRFSETEFHDRMDFVKLANALGVKAYRIEDEEDMEPILKKALQETNQGSEPVVIDCILPKNEEA